MDSSMSFDELRQKFGKEWPAIAKARSEAVARLDQVRSIVQVGANGTPIDSEDISVVAFGSLAREEWTRGSDLDWTLLIDGGVDHEHAHAASIFRGKVAEAGLKQPGPSGVFGTLTFSHDLVHQIGGEDDSNRNTTRRMLLLLESRPVNADGAYNRVIDGILNRYVQNDFRQFRLKVPRFLQNDLHRFWRTMCVDYANKYRERAGEGWATRIIKLRMSRKLIFAAGILTCFDCDPAMIQRVKPELAKNASPPALVDYLRGLFRRPALEIMAEALLRYGTPATVSLILDSYDRFLTGMDDGDLRKQLDSLPPHGEEMNQNFRELIQHSRDFEKGLLQLFFDDDPMLASLTRHYGVF
jgi:hypothetical protein